MTTYIALLRGINVSGQKKIKMAELREQLAALPYHNVRTYIQSGNIIFERETADHELIAEEIRQNILQNYGFDVPVMILTAEDLNHVFAHHPFIHQRNEDPKFVHVTFLAEVPDAARVALLEEGEYAPEEFVLEERFLYFFSPQGYGKAKLDNNFLERKLKVRATTRNWRTIGKLKEMIASE